MKEQGEKLKLRKVGKNKKSKEIRQIFKCHTKSAQTTAHGINPAHFYYFF